MQHKDAESHAQDPWRRRSRLGAPWIAALALVALFALLACAVLLPYILATPQPTVNYVAELDRISRESCAECENAWPIYAVLQIECMGDTMERASTNTAVKMDWFQIDFVNAAVAGEVDDPRLESTWRFVREHSGMLDRLDALTTAPACFRPVDEPISGVEPPLTCAYLLGVPMEFALPRRLALFNAAAMRLAAESGDWDAVHRRLQTGLAMSRHLVAYPTLISRLMGRSIADSTLEALTPLILEGSPDAEVCDAIRRTLDAHARAVPPISYSLLGEEYVSKDFVQRAWARGWPGGGPAVLWADPFREPRSPTIWERLSNVRAIFHAHRNMVDRDDARFKQALDAALNADEASREATLDALEGFVSEVAPTLEAMEYVGFSDVGSAFATSIRFDRTNETTFAGMRLLLALAAHRARHGAWPKALNELHDPGHAIDPVSGVAFEYELTPTEALPFELAAPDTGQLPRWRVRGRPAIDLPEQ